MDDEKQVAHNRGLMGQASKNLLVRRYARYVLMYTRDILLWKAMGRKNPPHFIKQKHVRRFQRQYGLSFFVETGTYLGEMIQAVVKNFQEIYSIELDKYLFENAKARFKPYRHIHILHGDSKDVLREVLKQLSSPALFWLDGHFSGGITAKGEKETPIVDELLAIKEHYIPGHVILIDDASSFTGDGNYPTYSEVADMISAVDPQLKIKVMDDIICAYNPHLACFLRD